MCNECNGPSLRTDTSQYGDKLRKEIALEHIEREVQRQKNVVIEAAKNLRTLVSRDDHWCVESCHKCEARDTFDRELEKLEQLKNLYV